MYLLDRRVDYPLWKLCVANQAYIYIFVSEKLDGVHGWVAVYAELDVWILPDEVLQVIQKDVLAQRCADSDPYMADSKLLVIF